MKGSSRTSKPDMVEIITNVNNEYVNDIVKQMWGDGYTVKTVSVSRHKYQSTTTLVIVFTYMKD